MPDTYPPTRFGAVILRRLRQLELSQAQLARRSGVSPAFISKLINGRKTDCSVGTLHRLSGPLGGVSALAELASAMSGDMRQREAEAAFGALSTK